MPITQDRMLALIAAAQDYKQAFRKMEEQITRGAQKVSLGAADPTSEFMLLEGLLSAYAPHHKSGELIVSEALHFKHVAKRNERTRAKISQMRLEARRQGKSYQTDPNSPGFGTGTRLFRTKGEKGGRAKYAIDYEATKANNPALATVNDPPEDFNVEDL
jgi:hypothetical protein